MGCIYRELIKSEVKQDIFLPQFPRFDLIRRMAKRTLIRKSFPKIRIVSVKGEEFYQVDARKKAQMAGARLLRARPMRRSERATD
jgi:hypothetical protein